MSNVLHRSNEGMQLETNGSAHVATIPPLEQRTDVGALAASTQVTTAALDLGPAETRQHTRILINKNGLASAGEQLSSQWSDDGVLWITHLPSALGVSATNAFNNTSATSMNAQGIPIARYLRASYTNGSTPQTGLILSITPIAGI